MQIIPRIYFNGDCREAIELYKYAFGAAVDQIMTHGDVKVGGPEQKDLIINSQLAIGEQKLHLADNMNIELLRGNQVSFTVIMNNQEEVLRAYEKLKEGGTIMMEPTPTFFSPCHCSLTDKFGVIWQINCTK